MVIWIIGLSGAGKTTLGREIVRQWRLVDQSCVLLDGDELRDVFRHTDAETAYTVHGRRANAETIAALCALLDRQRINVVCCILSIFPDMRLENRHRFSRYFEVFLDASMSSLRARDAKGLYAAAEDGTIRDVVGIDIPFERPITADMVIDTSGALTDVTGLAGQVLSRAGVTGE
ncbi:MAG: adenylyl-sulfate kinase [Proteobacteria bacterium]|nr:MAG: adenylyl-sulfate kinase [Pseudomonadota bacterium]